MKIVPAITTKQVEQARELFREYAASLEIDLCFQDFEAELAGLPGEYAQPSGRLLLAVEGRVPAGCVALRRIEDEICEMKRLYVRPAFQGKGHGRALVLRIIREARGAGYRFMRLDTLPSMQAAQALYESLGFREIGPYRQNPVPGARFMELQL